MRSGFTALAVLISLLICSSRLAADVNVLIIGSTRDSGEMHNSGVWWNAQKPAYTPNSTPFSPTQIGTQLQSILAQDGRGAVNVTVLDRYASEVMSIGWIAYSYNLATWFHYPYPAGAETNRWANLRGEAGTVWDYVVLIGDPYTMEHTPGMYAYGVAKIAEEVAKGPAQLVLLMPWPGASSTSSLAHYKEVVYRTGRSGGFKVAPAALAWQACGSPTGASHPTTAGAYIAAASIYSSIYNQSASASGYSFNDPNADTAFTTYTNNNSAPQYTGVFGFQNPYKILDDKRRDVHMSERGTSTEEGFKGKVKTAMDRCKVSYLDSVYNDKYNSNTPADDGLNWPAANPMPIAFNYGRDGFYSESFKSYLVNPAYWQLAFGYYYQNNTFSQPVETANDLHIGLMQEQDNDLANRMINEAPSARNIPIRTLWAQIHKAYPTLNPLRDGSGPHLNTSLDEAVGSYLYTIYSGRCPLDPKPATDDITWTCRRIGYETAWMAGRCQSRAPGFKVTPSLATKRTITPGTTETMSVQFILPPKQDVTVSISVSNTNAASLSTQSLVFTPANHSVPQQVTLTGLAGSLASEVFNVSFQTVSQDEACNQVSDSWEYTINRPITSTVTFDANGGTAASPATKSVTSGTTYGTLATTSRGGFTFAGWFTAASGGTLVTSSTTVTASANHTLYAQWTAAATYTVSYLGNGNTGGTVPSNQTKTQGVGLVLATNTGGLTKTGYVFSGWNTAADGSGTSYAVGATYTNDAAVTLHARWNIPPVVNAGADQIIYLTPGVAWSPAQLAPQLWLDADDTSTITLNGTTVSHWADKSGFNRHATAVTTSQPTATTAGLNGKRVLAFDGNSDVLTVDLDFLAAVSHSAFIVTKPTAYSNIYGAANANAGANSLHVGFTNAASYRINHWGNDYGPVLTSNFVAGSANILNFIWYSGTSKQILANGKSEGISLSPVPGTIGTMSGGGRIGRTTNHTFFGGDIAELVIITGAVSATDRQRMEGYLAHNWGLAANLAADHPHKSGAPGGASAVATLDGTATDTDPLTTTWSVVSGPASVSFANAAAIDTTATFPATGTYTLRLTANDGSQAVSDDIEIAVTPLPTYTISYQGNNQTGGTAPSNQIKTHDLGLILSAAGTLTRTGHTFSGWNTAADGTGTHYAPGSTFSANASLTLYATWAADPVYHFSISAIASPQTVGTAISGITITARSSAELTDTSFTGTVTFGGTAGITGTSANFTNGVLSGVSLTPLFAGSNRTLTVNDGAGHTGSATFTVQSVYANWSGTPFPGVLADTNPSLDFDGGSLPTGIEWVVGGDPTNAADDAGLAPTLTTGANGKLLFIYRRTTRAKDDARTTIAAQYGSNLTDWTNAVHQGVGTNQITITESPGGPGLDIVTVALPSGLASDGELFVRLNAVIEVE